MHLLQVAHQFEIKDLVDTCVAKLSSRCNENSIVEQLMLSDQLQLDDFKEKCIAFGVRSGCLQTIQDSEAWARLVETRPRLVADIVRRLVPPSPASKRRRIDNSVICV